MDKTKANYQLQRNIAWAGIGLFVIKFIAWYLTHSVSILTDMLESIINIISGFMGLYSLRLSYLPRDKNHPYGHGKVEFISAAIEGVLICLAGIAIAYQAIESIFSENNLTALDWGMGLILSTSIINYGMGYLAVRKGEKSKSLALVASGKHLQSDSYTTLGLVLGLVLIYFTHWMWIDTVVALLFAGFILFTGYKIVRSSVGGIMDEQDETILNTIIEQLQQHRNSSWVDLHNLRTIRYGGVLHLDGHITLPRYFTVAQAHHELELLESVIKNHIDNNAESFIHIDACQDNECQFCTMENCPIRSQDFEKQIAWTINNLPENQRHALGIL